MNRAPRSPTWRRIVACVVALVSYCIGALATGLASVIAVLAGIRSSPVPQPTIEFYRVSGYLVWASGALVTVSLLKESRWVVVSVGIWVGAVVAAAVALFGDDIRDSWPQALGLLVVAGGLAWATLRLAPPRPHESGV